MQNEDIPSFNKISPNKVQTGIQKLIVNFDSDFNETLGKFEKGFYLFILKIFIVSKKKSFYFSKIKQLKKHLII